MDRTDYRLVWMRWGLNLIPSPPFYEDIFEWFVEILWDPIPCPTTSRLNGILMKASTETRHGPRIQFISIHSCGLARQIQQSPMNEWVNRLSLALSPLWLFNGSPTSGYSVSAERSIMVGVTGNGWRCDFRKIALPIRISWIEEWQRVNGFGGGIVCCRGRIKWTCIRIHTGQRNEDGSWWPAM